MSELRKHFSITKKEWKKQKRFQISPSTLFDYLPLFDPFETNNRISAISLMFYIDKRGDFRKKPAHHHRRIALAIFNSLDAENKFEVYNYLEAVGFE